LIPTLVVAPLFMNQGVEFGVIAQAGMAFATLLGAFSLVITQFQTISSYASVVTRLGEFLRASKAATTPGTTSRIRFSAASDHFACSELTLYATDTEGKVLVRNLNASFVAGKRVLVNGSNQAARVALFGAAAGLHEAGAGTIVRPPPEKLVFLPERPYLVSSTLRELLVPSGSSRRIDDDEISGIIRELGLESAVKEHGGLDTARHWMEILSLDEQQRLSIARAILAKPDFALLDQLDLALGDAEHERVLKLFAGHGITCVSFGDRPPEASQYDARLDLNDDGSWKWMDLR
jgi:putative ATP-binding cassette transporter